MSSEDRDGTAAGSPESDDAAGYGTAAGRPGSGDGAVAGSPGSGEGAAQGRVELLAALGGAMQLSTSRAVFFHQAMAAHVGVNVTDFNCFNILVLEGPLTVGGLAERCGLTKGGAITASVDRLQKAGLVRRERDPNDRRKVIVTHTDEGVARIIPMLERFTSDWVAILNSYPDQELRVLLDYTERSNIAAYSATLRLQQA